MLCGCVLHEINLLKFQSLVWRFRPGTLALRKSRCVSWLKLISLLLIHISNHPANRHGQDMPKAPQSGPEALQSTVPQLKKRKSEKALTIPADMLFQRFWGCKLSITGFANQHHSWLPPNIILVWPYLVLLVVGVIWLSLFVTVFHFLIAFVEFPTLPSFKGLRGLAISFPCVGRFVDFQLSLCGIVVLITNSISFLLFLLEVRKKPYYYVLDRHVLLER